MEALEPLAGPELERMLARYARVRLEPSQAQARRARAAVMEEAWRRHLDPHSVLRTPAPNARVAAATAAPASHRLPFSGWGARRLGVAFAAAALAGLMLGSSVFAASRAGGPLYESRLAIESLSLPADPAARAAARLAQADARLGEALEAGFRHDDQAVAAALGAYDATIEELITTSGPAAAEALAAVQNHRAVLLQLAEQVPDTAASGIDTALESSNRVIVRLAESGAGGPDATGGTGGPHGNGGGNGSGASGAGGAGGAGNAGGAGGSGGGNANGAGSGNGGAGNGNGNTGGSNPGAGTPAPTTAPTTPPTATPEPTPNPGKTPKPHRTPPDDVPDPATGSPAPSDGARP